MAMPGPFEWLILVGIALFVAGTLWGRYLRRQRGQVRGFEVKQPAGGESPALREKDDHHG